MPSPFGHALAGAAIGFVADRPAGRDTTPEHSSWLFPVIGATVAALPDADLLFAGFHRTATHSLVATVAVLIVASVVTGQVTGKIWWRLVLMAGVAHLSHLLLDWLGTDHLDPSGIELLWPFSARFYISGVDWFPPVERKLSNPEMWSINLRAFMAELLWIGPFALVAWWATRRRRSRDRFSSPGNRRPPSA